MGVVQWGSTSSLTEGKVIWCWASFNSKWELVREKFALTQAEMELALKPGCSFVCPSSHFSLKEPSLQFFFYFPQSFLVLLQREIKKTIVTSQKLYALSNHNKHVLLLHCHMNGWYSHCHFVSFPSPPAFHYSRSLTALHHWAGACGYWDYKQEKCSLLI